MNEAAHAEIFTAAFQALPAAHRDRLAPTEKLLYDAGNYPDYFDDPTRPDADKARIDPDWRRFCRLDDAFGVPGFHFWPAPIPQQFDRTPLYEYYFAQMLAALAAGDGDAFLKFAGCLSHAMGDATQPAHLGPDPNNVFMAQLMPKPDRPYLDDFHYHTTVEAVTGRADPLGEPETLGASPAEAAWRLAGRTMEAMRYCRRFLIPTIQAIFDNDPERAAALAVEPVTLAARLTRDALHTALRLSEGAPLTELPPTVDIANCPTVREEHDMVYGGMLPGGNKDIPPNNRPIAPGVLLDEHGRRFRPPGFGMLPGSGMYGERWAYSTWRLPAGTFARFTAVAGMHADIAADGAARFVVELDGRPVHDSGRMTRTTPAARIDVPLDTATELTLKVWDANEGKTFWKNHAFWGAPTLHRA